MTEKDKLENEEFNDKTGTQEIPEEEQEADKNYEAEEAEVKNDSSSKGDDESPMDKLAKENQDLKDKYVRLYSEFENFRRRTAKERLEMINTASVELIRELLPIMDDFERSFKAEAGSGKASKNNEGSRLIHNKLEKLLSSKGLEPMNDLVGKTFDAEYHEAITQIPAPSDDLKGKIVDVVEKGYMLGGKVVRFAKVVIGN
ncbi:MAG: nucleotide exchange factor GrpE [Cyclobacteriaceae bacterium]